MDILTNTENSFPQGETTFGEYAATSSITGAQFSPSTYGIQNGNMEFNVYQTSNNVYSDNYIQSNSANEDNNQFEEYQTTNSSSYEYMAGGDNIDTNYSTPIETNDYQVSFGEYNINGISGGNYEGFNDTYDQSSVGYQVQNGNTNTYLDETNNLDFQSEVNLENFGNEAQFGEYQITSNTDGIQSPYSVSYDLPSSYSNTYQVNEQIGSSFEVNEYQSTQTTDNNYYGAFTNGETFTTSTPTFESNVNVDLERFKMNEPIFENTIQTTQYEASTSTIDYQTAGYEASTPTIDYQTAGYETSTPTVDYQTAGYETSTPSIDYQTAEYETSTPTVDYQTAGYEISSSTVDYQTAEYEKSTPTTDYQTAGYETSTTTLDYQTSSDIVGTTSYNISKGYQTTEPIVESTPSFDYGNYNASTPIESIGYQTSETTFENNYNVTNYQFEPYQGESTSLYQNYETNDLKMMEQVDTASTLETNLYTENTQNYETNINLETFDQNQSKHPIDAFFESNSFETYKPNEVYNVETNEYLGNYQKDSPILEELPTFDTILASDSYNNEYQNSNLTFEVDTTAFNTQTYETYTPPVEENINYNLTSDINTYTPTETLIENSGYNFGIDNYQIAEQTNVNYGYENNANLEYSQTIDINNNLQNETNIHYNEYNNINEPLNDTISSQNYESNIFQTFETGIDTTSTLNTTEAFITSSPSSEITPLYGSEFNTTYQNNEILGLETTNQDYISTPSFDITPNYQTDYQDYKLTEQTTETNDFEITPTASNFETATNYETTNYDTTLFDNNTYQTNEYNTNMDYTQYTANSPTFDSSSSLQETNDYQFLNEIKNVTSTPYETRNQPLDGGLNFTDLNQNYDFGTTNTTFNEYNTNITSTIAQPNIESYDFSYQTPELAKETIATTTNTGLDLGFFDTTPTLDTNTTFTDYPSTSISNIITSYQVPSTNPVNIPEPAIPSTLETGTTYGEYITTTNYNKDKYITPINIIPNYNQTSISTTTKPQPITIKIPKITKVYVPKKKIVYIPSKKKIYITKPNTNDNTTSFIEYSNNPNIQSSYIPNNSTNVINTSQISIPKTSIDQFPAVSSNVAQTTYIPSTSTVTTTPTIMPQQNISQVPSIQMPKIIKYNNNYKAPRHGYKYYPFSSKTYMPKRRAIFPENKNYAIGNKYINPRYCNRTYIARKL